MNEPSPFQIEGESASQEVAYRYSINRICYVAGLLAALPLDELLGAIQRSRVVGDDAPLDEDLAADVALFDAAKRLDKTVRERLAASARRMGGRDAHGG